MCMWVMEALREWFTADEVLSECIIDLDKAMLRTLCLRTWSSEYGSDLKLPKTSCELSASVGSVWQYACLQVIEQCVQRLATKSSSSEMTGAQDCSPADPLLRLANPSLSLLYLLKALRFWFVAQLISLHQCFSVPRSLTVLSSLLQHPGLLLRPHHAGCSAY